MKINFLGVNRDLLLSTFDQLFSDVIISFRAAFELPQKTRKKEEFKNDKDEKEFNQDQKPQCPSNGH